MCLKHYVYFSMIYKLLLIFIKVFKNNLTRSPFKYLKTCTTFVNITYVVFGKEINITHKSQKINLNSTQLIVFFHV